MVLRINSKNIPQDLLEKSSWKPEKPITHINAIIVKDKYLTFEHNRKYEFFGEDIINPLSSLSIELNSVQDIYVTSKDISVVTESGTFKFNGYPACILEFMQEFLACTHQVPAPRMKGFCWCCIEDVSIKDKKVKVNILPADDSEPYCEEVEFDTFNSAQTFYKAVESFLELGYLKLTTIRIEK